MPRRRRITVKFIAARRGARIDAADTSGWLVLRLWVDGWFGFSGCGRPEGRPYTSDVLDV